MLDISLGELAVIGAVALVVLGPEKAAEAARFAGRAKRALDKAWSEAAGGLEALRSSAGIEGPGGQGAGEPFEVGASWTQEVRLPSKARGPRRSRSAAKAGCARVGALSKGPRLRRGRPQV